MTISTRTATQDETAAAPILTVATDCSAGKIVVAVDSSPPAKHALRWAIAEAQRRQVGCQVLEIQNPSTIDLGDAERALSTLVDDILIDVATIPAPKVEVLGGHPVEVLAEAARHAGLLVIGSESQGLISRFFGSVGSALLHRGICPTIVVPPDADTHGQHGRIAVGVDGSDGAARALDWAEDEARRRHAELVVIHAWHIPATTTSPFAPTVAVPIEEYERSASARLARALMRLEARTDVTVVPCLIQGVADDELVKAGAHADLIVVGSRGHTALAAVVLGSTSRGCVRRSPCAVAVIP
jgi:nucleotide-binding universal stress UspA family protein